MLDQGTLRLEQLRSEMGATGNVARKGHLGKVTSHSGGPKVFPGARETFFGLRQGAGNVAPRAWDPCHRPGTLGRMMWLRRKLQ